MNILTDNLIHRAAKGLITEITPDPAMIGNTITEATEKFINNFDTQKLSGQTGKKTTETVEAFLKQLNTGQISALAGQKINDASNGMFDGLNLGDIGDRAGQEFKDGVTGFSKPAGKALEQAIYDTLGKAVHAVSLSTLPYIAAGIAVTVGGPLALYYLYYKAKNNIGRPKLATEVHQRSIFTPLTESFASPARSSAVKPIYNQEITRKINDVINAVKNIRENGGYFQNMLVYGPGGTGKTLISEFIAKNSGMSYIKMSGGDLAQYIKRGEHVTELNKLLDQMDTSWRPWSTRPWILFIDEAESLCKDRDKIPSAELLELQNAFLNRTGTQSKKFMVILSTNRMEDLDEAILSRMDHKIFIGPPAEKERISIISSYVPQFFSSQEKSLFFAPDKVAKIAKNTNGLTGRALFKLLNAIANKQAATKNRHLTQNMIDETVQDFMRQEAEVIQRREQKSANPSPGRLKIS